MPSITIPQQKRRLRSEVRNLLCRMSGEELARSDSLLFAHFLALPQVERAETLLLFWGMAGLEPDTAALIQPLARRNKRVCMPRMLPARGLEARLYRPGDPTVQAAFGITEPDPDAPLLRPDQIDLALVPALCYDRGGNRLGFGGGYYDRWLAGYAALRWGCAAGHCSRMQSRWSRMTARWTCC